MELIAIVILLVLTAKLSSLRAALFVALFVGAIWYVKPGERTERATLVVKQVPEVRQMATSNACRSCHPRAYTTWSRSYHRTMTQRPSGQTVLGDFSQTVSDGVRRWNMERHGDDFFVEMSAGDAEGKRAKIELLTGSHHLQNYWMDLGQGWLVQFPWAWWISQRRWIPVDASFLQPPNAPKSPQVWNDSCIYCHTTGGTRGASREAQSTRSTVGELGIACESCHGPGVLHAQKSRSPFDRYLSWLRPRQDSDVVNPGDQEVDSDAVCGQCHGVFTHRSGRDRDLRGDSFRPGQAIETTRFFPSFLPVDFDGALPVLQAKSPGRVQVSSRLDECSAIGMSPDGLLLDCRLANSESVHLRFGGRSYTGIASVRAGQTLVRLSEWSEPQWRETLDQLGYEGIDLTPYDWDAFWRDGAVRTVGREYNGLKSSACSPQLRCVSCHEMHGESPNDQLKRGHRGDTACVECHSEYVNNPGAHSHHGSDSAGSRCQNCHMPHTTYGLLGASRSHKIDIPAPVRMQRLGRPNPCNLCHLDRPIQWSEDHIARWYNKTSLMDEGPNANVPAGPRWVLEGDAAVRAIVTWHLGWDESVRTSEAKRWAGPYLRESLNDDYAAVRGIAEQVVKRESPASTYDYNDPEHIRMRSLPRALESWGASPLIESKDQRLIDERGVSTQRYRSLRGQRDLRPVRIAE